MGKKSTPVDPQIFVHVDDYQELEAHWGVKVPSDLIATALTHRSYAFENECPSNERLEFMGDAVLQLVITDYLYQNFPDLSEGDLAPIRAATVAQTPLARAARRLELGKYLRLGRGECKTGGRDKDSLLSDCMEALIGAIYLSAGWQSVQSAILRVLSPEIAAACAREEIMDYKTEILELAQQFTKAQPEYEVSFTGPDHARVFTASVQVEALARGIGQGTSRRMAENQAAKNAVLVLRKIPRPGN